MTKRKIDYRLIATMTILCVVLILAVARATGGRSAPPIAMATVTRPPLPNDHPAMLTPLTPIGLASGTTPTRTSSALDADDKPVGVWIQADSNTAIQLQISDWKATTTRARLYVSSGRTPFQAIYQGQAMQRTRTTTAFTMVESSATNLPNSYEWCRRLSGTIVPTIRAGEHYLDVAAVCSDGTGSGIIHHVRGGARSSSIPSGLIYSGSHVLRLGSSAG